VRIKVGEHNGKLSIENLNQTTDSR